MPCGRYARCGRSVRRPGAFGGGQSRVHDGRRLRDISQRDRGLLERHDHAAQRPRARDRLPAGWSRTGDLDNQLPRGTDPREQRDRSTGCVRRNRAHLGTTSRRHGSRDHRRERILPIPRSLTGSRPIRATPHRSTLSRRWSTRLEIEVAHPTLVEADHSFLDTTRVVTDTCAADPQKAGWVRASLTSTREGRRRRYENGRQTVRSPGRSLAPLAGEPSGGRSPESAPCPDPDAVATIRRHPHSNAHSASCNRPDGGRRYVRGRDDDSDRHSDSVLPGHRRYDGSRERLQDHGMRPHFCRDAGSGPHLQVPRDSGQQLDVQADAVER